MNYPSDAIAAGDAALQRHLSECVECWDALADVEHVHDIDMRLPPRPERSSDAAFAAHLSYCDWTDDEGNPCLLLRGHFGSHRPHIDPAPERHDDDYWENDADGRRIGPRAGSTEHRDHKKGGTIEP